MTTPELACRICATTRLQPGTRTCPTCLNQVRNNLHEVGRLTAGLPTEAKHRGPHSEAMTLLAPSIDPEALGHIEASIAAGRLPATWLADPDPTDRLHPAYVIGNWDMLVRDALDHDEAGTWTINTGISYLDTQLTYLASYEHLEFPDLANDLAGCRRHLEQVLHDGTQHETGAPCMNCRVPLRREWGKLAAADGWRCPRCHDWRSDTEYRLNVAELHRDSADWLTDREMELRTGVKAATVRSWARSSVVPRRLESGRTVYSVAQVLEVARGKGLIA